MIDLGWNYELIIILKKEDKVRVNKFECRGGWISMNPDVCKQLFKSTGALFSFSSLISHFFLILFYFIFCFGGWLSKSGKESPNTDWVHEKHHSVGWSSDQLDFPGPLIIDGLLR